MKSRDLERAWHWAEKHCHHDVLAWQLFNCRVALGTIHSEPDYHYCIGERLDSILALIDYRDALSEIVIKKIKGQRI
jgi:hypothetical protein